MICKTCGNEYSEDCNHRQGRCPHHAPMISEYQKRFYNLIEFFKNIFNRDAR
jgi:hypothetical protein